MAIESMSGEGRKIAPPKEFSEKAHISSLEQYEEMYKRSIEDSDGFWADVADEMHWFKKWDTVQSWNLSKHETKWFINGKTNMSYNCLDRHLETRADKVAIIWQGEPEDDVRNITYKELHEEVCKFANVLKSKGIEKGDRVCL